MAQESSLGVEVIAKIAGPGEVRVRVQVLAQGNALSQLHVHFVVVLTTWRAFSLNESGQVQCM